MSAPPQLSFTVTHHARDRARERVGWTGGTTERMLDRVFLTGVDASSPRSPIQRYVAEKVATPPGFTAKVFGEKVFIFRCTGDRSYELITVYSLPSKVRRASRRRSEGQAGQEEVAGSEARDRGLTLTRDGIVITRPARQGVAFFCQRRKPRG
jgi:hypothetical protein